ncbi:MAG: esterase-like activity of phytase family protein [Paracoccaceae bacterium]
MRKRTQFGLAALAAIGLVLHAMAGSPAPQTYIGSFPWWNSDSRFGGLSAVEVSADGNSFVALSDNGTLISGQVQRGADGRISRITEPVLTTLLGPDGQPLAWNRNDSEGLAIADDGTLFISQEGPARVLRYAAATVSAEVLSQHADFKTMQPNSSLEAIAIRSDGALFTLPERSGALDRPFPVYRYADGQWTRPFSIPRVGAFLPVAADFGPDGKFYILERNFRGLLGFESRVRRFEVAGDSLGIAETVLESPTGAHQNLEGLSVWQDAKGTLRLTMISDDNFRFFLGTTLVEYRLPD